MVVATLWGDGTLIFRGLAIYILVSGFFIAGCGGGGSSFQSAAIEQTNVCTTNENGAENKLGVHKLIRFSVTKPQTLTITINKTSGLSSSDPDLALYRNGLNVGRAESFTANSETLTVNAAAGDYVLDVFEFKYTSSSATPRTTCYDVAVSFSAGSPKTEPKAVEKVAVLNTVKTGIASSCPDVGEITVTGKITYDLVPHKSSGGLDYSATTMEPVKGAVVEMRCNGAMYDTVITNADGTYSLTASANVNNFVRVYAQMRDTTSPGTWNFQVVDNTSGGALYTMDGTTINSGANVPNHDLNAFSGWQGNSYDDLLRIAAPFAILDSVYQAFQKVLVADSTAVFPALNLNWSVNNVAVSGDRSVGDINTSHFDGTAIYILGDADSDTDEYDDHVIIHEWGHYFEHNFSRSDSIGGPHSRGQRLDIRLAFGEGFGNAFSGIASGDPIYRDSGGGGQSVSLVMLDVSSNNCLNAGWYSECSVQSLLYDFSEQGIIGVGFLELYNVLTGEQKNTAAVTSIFSFVKPLKDNNPAAASAIDALVSGQNIDVITDIYGDSQLTNNPGSLNQLPIHTQL